MGQHAGEEDRVVGKGLSGKGSMAGAASSSTTLSRIQRRLPWTESMRDMQRDIWGLNFVLALDLRSDFTGQLEVSLPPASPAPGMDAAHMASIP